MRSKLFAFIGFYEKSIEQDIELYQEKLNRRFREKKIQIYFERKNALLLARFDEVSFYISFSNNKDELKDWYQMSIDAEISSEGNPVNKAGLLKRYELIENLPSNPYKKIHFDIGMSIVEEIENFKEMALYAFQ